MVGPIGELDKKRGQQTANILLRSILEIKIKEGEGSQSI